MVSTSDIVLELILQKGYGSLTNFAKKNNINRSLITEAYRTNCWGRNLLKRISEVLGINIINLSTTSANME